MYLSRLVLDPRSRSVQRDLADCHDLHRTIMAAFPQAPPQTDARASFGVLHRLETSDGVVTLLIQSSLQPDWCRLPPGYLSVTGAGLENPGCKPLDESYRALIQGMALRFRLRANPTRKIGTKTGPDGQRNNGQRVPLTGDDARIEWLRRKGEESGFELLAVHAGSPVADVLSGHEGKLRGRDQANTVTIAPVLFEGKLKVTDVQKFRQALRFGVGPGKAYGCGLLSVAPARGDP